MTYTVGTKGQIVIAKEIRDTLGVKKGWIALQRVVGDHIEVTFVPPEHTTSLKGSLAKHLKVHIAPGSEWDAARNAAWRSAAEERTPQKERAL